jgi:hypothetical protein
MTKGRTCRFGAGHGSGRMDAILGADEHYEKLRLRL